MKILKYLDLFGIHFHFYIGNKRKLYTSYGGIISLICLFFCVLIFFILAFKEISHKNPISNMSSISQAGYHKVTFKDEKIWIPWRIIDFKKKFIDYKNVLYPTIYIKTGEKDNIENRFTFKTQKINYTLCNETDFANRGKNHFIDVALDELYCIEFDNIELGGGWNANFLNYLQLDISICKDGIEYDKNNIDCTNFENLKEYYFQNDTWAFEYFYPIVEYQPTNYENPIIVIYKNHLYNFSSHLNKDERMYVQEYVLNDDKGLVFNDDKNSSFWGYFSSDFDILYSNGDLLNEKHSSKLYSLSIFIDSGKILYTRRFNKIYTVIANVFPLFNFVFFIFDPISYMIKTIMTEKYLSELFFQRINENDKINIDKDKRKSAGFFYHKLNISRNDSMFKNNVYKTNKENNRMKNETSKKSNNNNDNNDNDFSSRNSDNNNKEENDKNNFSNNSNINNNDKNNNEENNKNNYNNSNKSNKMVKKINKLNKLNKETFSKNSSNDTNTNKSNLEKFNNKFKKLMTNRNNPNSNNNNSSLYPFNSPKHNNFVDINLKNTNSGKNENIKNNQKEININDKLIKNDIINNDYINNNDNNDNNNEINESSERKNNYSQFNFYKNRGLNNSAIITRFRLKGSLFKMKDYIYSFFIKAVRKEYKYLSKEFGVIFNFLSDIYDISSYLQLYRQFHILSGFLLDNVANIDLNHKININNKELFEQIALKNKNIFYFALKERFNKISNK